MLLAVQYYDIFIRHNLCYNRRLRQETCFYAVIVFVYAKPLTFHNNKNINGFQTIIHANLLLKLSFFMLYMFGTLYVYILHIYFSRLSSKANAMFPPESWNTNLKNLWARKWMRNFIIFSFITHQLSFYCTFIAGML